MWYLVFRAFAQSFLVLCHEHHEACPAINIQPSQCLQERRKRTQNKSPRIFAATTLLATSYERNLWISHSLSCSCFPHAGGSQLRMDVCELDVKLAKVAMELPRAPLASCLLHNPMQLCNDPGRWLP